jgi:rRNA maturation endonuclease Nob1
MTIRHCGKPVKMFPDGWECETCGKRLKYGYKHTRETKHKKAEVKEE